MKLYKKLILFGLISLFFYLLGTLVPIKSLSFGIQYQQLKTPEFLQLLVGIFSALVTLGAVIIALFKEDIRKVWEFSKISITTPEDNLFEELNSSTSNEAKALEAIKYNCKLEIYNVGSIAALDLEIFMESLVFKGSDYPTPQMVCSDKYVSWNELYDQKINLSAQGKRTIDILGLMGPSEQSSPGGKNTDIPAKLTIAGVEINPDYKNGKWTASFIVSSTNTKPTRFKIEVSWNGRWHKRASEMKNNLVINLENK